MPLGKPLLDALERMGCGGLVLNKVGQVVRSNATATAFLDGHEMGNQAAKFNPEGLRTALNALLGSKEASRFRMHEESWIVVHRMSAKPFILHAVPIGGRKNAPTFTALIMIDLNKTPPGRPEALQKIFGLTLSEARLASEIAVGKTTEEISASSSVAVGTLRKQLARVFDKTGARRQSDLVALLTRVAILP